MKEVLLAGVNLLIRCHVMEVESFEDEEVAKLLNDWFVSIKVRNVTIRFGFGQF